MSANDLITFGIKQLQNEFCNIYLTQEMQNDWTMNIKQNVMSRTRIIYDKFHTKKSKMAASLPFFFFLIFTILEIFHDS